jgi:hypothetical protein
MVPRSHLPRERRLHALAHPGERLIVIMALLGGRHRRTIATIA